MAVTLYNTYIDYNGNRTFVNISNEFPYSNCGNIQCNMLFKGLVDNSETVTYKEHIQSYDCNCNCACNC